MSAKRTVKLVGADFLRQRIACSVLSSRPVTVNDIRPDDEEPGLLDHEVSLLRLVAKLSNGSRVEINETGTSFHFRPGWIQGGRVEHDCGRTRGIAYFIEAIVHMCVFARKPVTAVLKGVTNSPLDVSLDSLFHTLKATLQAFGMETDGFSIKIVSRGCRPRGGGEVVFTCPVVRELGSITLVEEGLVKRVRGTAYTAKVSPQVANRMVTSARGLLLKFLPDVRVETDHRRGVGSGESPGFGVSLLAETTSGCVKAIDCVAIKGSLPEDLGAAAAELLCEEIARGGCVDSHMQTILPLFMILTTEDVSKVRVGPLTPYTIQYLRHIRDFFGSTFKVKETGDDDGAGAVFMSCLGLGYKNFAKKVT